MGEHRVALKVVPEGQTDWIQTPFPALTSYVVLGKLSFLRPDCFLLCKMGIKISIRKVGVAIN